MTNKFLKSLFFLIKIYSVFFFALLLPNSASAESYDSIISNSTCSTFIECITEIQKLYNISITLKGNIPNNRISLQLDHANQKEAILTVLRLFGAKNYSLNITKDHRNALIHFLNRNDNFKIDYKQSGKIIPNQNSIQKNTQNELEKNNDNDNNQEFTFEELEILLKNEEIANDTDYIFTPDEVKALQREEEISREPESIITY